MMLSLSTWGTNPDKIDPSELCSRLSNAILKLRDAHSRLVTTLDQIVGSEDEMDFDEQLRNDRAKAFQVLDELEDITCSYASYRASCGESVGSGASGILCEPARPHTHDSLSAPASETAASVGSWSSLLGMDALWGKNDKATAEGDEALLALFEEERRLRGSLQVALERSREYCNSGPTPTHGSPHSHGWSARAESSLREIEATLYSLPDDASSSFRSRRDAAVRRSDLKAYHAAVDDAASSTWSSTVMGAVLGGCVALPVCVAAGATSLTLGAAGAVGGVCVGALGASALRSGVQRLGPDAREEAEAEMTGYGLLGPEHAALLAENSNQIRPPALSVSSLSEAFTPATPPGFRDTELVDSPRSKTHPSDETQWWPHHSAPPGGNERPRAADERERLYCDKDVKTTDCVTLNTSSAGPSIIRERGVCRDDTSLKSDEFPASLPTIANEDTLPVNANSISDGGGMFDVLSGAFGGTVYGIRDLSISATSVVSQAASVTASVPVSVVSSLSSALTSHATSLRGGGGATDGHVSDVPPEGKSTPMQF
eukprot:Rmarinus@m.10275